MNVRIDFPHVGCDLLALDVVDALHSTRIDISGENIYKHPMTGALRYMNLEHAAASDGVRDSGSYEFGSTTDFDRYGHRRISYDIVGVDAFERIVQIHTGVLLVNFHAPWCFHCRAFAPIWEHAAEMIRTEMRRTGRSRLSLGLASVDCMVEENEELCSRLHIQAYPTVRVYRAGSLHPSHANHTSLRDNAESSSHIEFEVYHGQRSAEAIAAFADSLLKEIVENSDGSTPSRLVVGHDFDGDGRRDSTVRSPGCSVNGRFVVNRVPGAFYFHPRSRVHSVGDLDLTHVITHLSFGEHAPGGPKKFVPPHQRKARNLIPKDMGGRFAGKSTAPTQFDADASGRTVFDHFVRVIPRTYRPLDEASMQIYEYTFSSHQHELQSDATEREMIRFRRESEGVTVDEFRRPEGPHVRFGYDVSAMGVVTREVRKPFLEWVLGCAAILGGLCTCSVGIERALYSSTCALKRRLGKKE